MEACAGPAREGLRSPKILKRGDSSRSPEARSGVNPDRVKKELADHSVAVEEWGGDTVAVEISALKNEGWDMSI